MEELIEFLVRGIVDSPDEVKVQGFDEDDGTVVLELTCAPDEIGRVIGRSGRTIGALRTIARAMPEADGHKVVLDIVE